MTSCLSVIAPGQLPTTNIKIAYWTTPFYRSTGSLGCKANILNYSLHFCLSLFPLSSSFSFWQGCIVPWCSGLGREALCEQFVCVCVCVCVWRKASTVFWIVFKVGMNMGLEFQSNPIPNKWWVNKSWFCEGSRYRVFHVVCPSQHDLNPPTEAKMSCDNLDSSHIISCSLHSNFGLSKQPEKHGIYPLKIYTNCTPSCINPTYLAYQPAMSLENS